MRDIEGDYKAAYLDEYEGYKAAGRDEDAARVADILRDSYGHDVDAVDEREPTGVVERPETGEQETAVAAPPPEAAVDPRPAAKKQAPPRRAAKKPGE
ncbi:hypothetical protein ACFVP3_23605 [Streptomyces sp. NPDC057806]|uniref:hypothetical protein n=1 Tax=Streptomyces sp. NPDC057806 TaxID=3346255 RepID=UPI0036D1EB0B